MGLQVCLFFRGTKNYSNICYPLIWALVHSRDSDDPTRLHALNFGDLKRAKGYGVRMELSIAQPDDWHLHLRDGELLETVVSHSAKQFGRAIIMPNLKPPVTTTAAAVSYRDSILKALQGNTDFTPLMTLYLTDKTSPDEIKLAS
ncbi:dihydroorotase, mitochondrial-like protein isoform X2, partial [Tanacetum coccineum]